MLKDVTVIKAITITRVYKHKSHTGFIIFRGNFFKHTVYYFKASELSISKEKTTELSNIYEKGQEFCKSNTVKH
jgi:hypothetical protein